jgi:hypothetical protein
VTRDFTSDGKLLSPGENMVIAEEWEGWPGRHVKAFTVTNCNGKAHIVLAKESRQEIDELLTQQRQADEVEARKHQTWLETQARREALRVEERRTFAREQRQYLKDLGFSHSDASNIFASAGPGAVREVVEYYAFAIQQLKSYDGQLLQKGLPVEPKRYSEQVRSALSDVLSGVGDEVLADMWQIEHKLGRHSMPVPSCGWSRSTKPYFRILRGALAIAKVGGPSKSI